MLSQQHDRRNQAAAVRDRCALLLEPSSELRDHIDPKKGVAAQINQINLLPETTPSTIKCLGQSSDTQLPTRAYVVVAF